MAVDSEPESVTGYVEMGMSCLGPSFDDEDRQRAVELGRKLMCEYPVSYHRKVAAAGAVYTSSRFSAATPSQSDVADAFDVSTSSVRSVHKDIWNFEYDE